MRIKNSFSKILITSCFVFVFLTPLSSQNPNGMIWEDSVYEQMEPLPYEKSVEDLPDSISLRCYSPTPGDQGKLGSCTAWAVANALTISKNANMENELLLEKDVSHSAAYIFNQIKLDNNCSGAYLSDALNLIQTQGACLASDFSYDPKSCKKQPSKVQREQASLYRIESFQPLFRKNDTTYVKETQIQLALAYQYPVIVAMMIPADFRSIPFSALDWSENNLVGHAMVVTGYNDCKNEFELMNSYGKDWNKDGFFRLSYDQFLKHVVYGYWIELGEGFGEK